LLAGESDAINLEARLFHKQRRIVWTELSVAMVRGAAGEPLYFVAQVRDITERKGIEERFRQSEERFRQLTENITEVFWMTNPVKDKILYVSPGYEKIWGRSCESVYERPAAWLEAIHPEDRERIKASAGLQSLGAYDEEYRIIRPDGSIRWVRDRAFPIKDRSGRVYRITGIAEDITERKETGEALKEGEERLRMAINAARMYTWDFDPATGRLIRSEHYREVYGVELPGSETSFLTFLQTIYPQDRKRMEQTLDRALREKTPFHVDFRVVRPDGEIRWLETQGHSDCDGQGTVTRMIGVTQDITERKRAEEALRASEERFRRYFEFGLIGMAITSGTKGCLEVNDRLCEILGYRRSELLRLTWPELTHPDDLAADVSHFNRVLAGEIDGYSIDKRFIRKDGEVIHATISVTCLRRPDSSIDAFLALIQDVTERKKAEEALRDAKEFSENLIQTANVMIIGLDTEGRIDIFNEAAEKITGYTLSEIKGKNWFEALVPKERYPWVWEYFSRLVAGETADAFENPILTKTGEERHIMWQTNQIRVNGKVVATISFGNDITERKRVEEALRKSDDRFRLIARATNDAVWDWDLTTNTLWWNESFKTLFGYKVEEIEAGIESWSHRLHPEDKERVLSETHAVINGGEQYWSAEYRFRRADGSYAVIFDRGYVVHVRNGKPVRMIGAMIDITERKRAEEALENYANRLQSLSGQLLEAQETERRRIARELHDEIGQSLTAIKMQLHAQRHSSMNRPTTDECIEIVNHALSQVRNLSLDLHPPQLDELGLVATLRWHLDRQVKAANLVPRFSADPLPARLRPDIEIACFRVAQEALTNVIRHAEAREVSITLRQCGGELHLIIRDDGRGFDVEAARDRAVQGASLGLIGMTERAELAGGRLEWRSNPGEGTELYAVFPLGEPASKKRSRRRKG
jgi:PAS domain S-box-containing protein